MGKNNCTRFKEEEIEVRVKQTSIPEPESAEVQEKLFPNYSNCFRNITLLTELPIGLFDNDPTIKPPRD